jgi:hypothetical protein
MGKNKTRKMQKKAAATEREFIVKEIFAGTRKLPEILADLIYTEYCRREERYGR